MRSRKGEKLQVAKPTRGICTTCRASFLAPNVDEARKLLLAHWCQTGHPTGTVNRKLAVPPLVRDDDDIAALAADNYGVLDD